MIRGLEMHASGICDHVNGSGKDYCPYWTSSDSCMKELLNDAIALLKEQEAKKPEIIMINGNGIQSGSCPCCRETVNDYRNEKYCGKCGQRLRWLE